MVGLSGEIGPSERRLFWFGEGGKKSDRGVDVVERDLRSVM